jgi:hypothetical protein
MKAFEKQMIEARKKYKDEPNLFELKLIERSFYQKLFNIIP